MAGPKASLVRDALWGGGSTHRSWPASVGGKGTDPGMAFLEGCPARVDLGSRRVGGVAAMAVPQKSQGLGGQGQRLRFRGGRW